MLVGQCCVGLLSILYAPHSLTHMQPHCASFWHPPMVGALSKPLVPTPSFDSISLCSFPHHVNLFTDVRSQTTSCFKNKMRLQDLDLQIDF